MENPRVKQTTIVNLRLKAAQLTKDFLEGKYELDLTPDDIQFILTCRALGYGTFEKLTVTEGRPSVGMRVEERIDFRKELKFDF